MAFQINIKDKGDYLMIYLSGDLDINSSPRLRSEVQEVYSKEAKDIIFDFTDLDYLDSTGLGALMSLYKNTNMDDKYIKIINAKANIKKLFFITDLNEEFHLED